MLLKDRYTIERKYISFGKSRSGHKLTTGTPKFVVDHEVGGSGDAEAHYRYFNAHRRSASAHTFIDHIKILEIIPLTEKAWHVQYQSPLDNEIYGYNANDAAIGVELCRTSFGPSYDRYVWYNAYLCKRFNLDPRKHLISHKILDPTRRRDPQSWLEPNGISWGRFIDDVAEYVKYWDASVIQVGLDKLKGSENMILRKGDKGAEVKALQEKLLKAGEKLPRYGADGDFGNETEEAVKSFQVRHKLTVDGIAGPQTFGKLDEVLAPKEPVKASTQFTLGGKKYEIREL